MPGSAKPGQRSGAAWLCVSEAGYHSWRRRRWRLLRGVRARTAAGGDGGCHAEPVVPRADAGSERREHRCAAHAACWLGLQLIMVMAMLQPIMVMAMLQLIMVMAMPQLIMVMAMVTVMIMLVMIVITAAQAG